MNLRKGVLTLSLVHGCKIRNRLKGAGTLRTEDSVFDAQPDADNGCQDESVGGLIDLRRVESF